MIFCRQTCSRQWQSGRRNNDGNDVAEISNVWRIEKKKNGVAAAARRRAWRDVTRQAAWRKAAAVKIGGSVRDGGINQA